jgi:hypothetical protein
MTINLAEFAKKSRLIEQENIKVKLKKEKEKTAQENKN